MTYTLIANSTSVTRDADSATIPANPTLFDWQTYQAWLAAGNTPNPAPTPPAVVPSFTFLQFMALFAASEQAAIVASSDTQIKLFTLMAAGAGSLQLNNAEVIAGVNYLATAGVITSARATAILAGQAPS